MQGNCPISTLPRNRERNEAILGKGGPRPIHMRQIPIVEFQV
jgi:hypothetical protein